MTILMATIWYSLILIIYTYWLYPIAGSGLDRLQHQGAASHCPCSCLDGSLHLSRAPGLLGMYGMEWKHAQPFKVLSGGCGGKNAIEGIGPLAISGEVRNRLVAGWGMPRAKIDDTVIYTCFLFHIHNTRHGHTRIYRIIVFRPIMKNPQLRGHFLNRPDSVWG